MGRYGRVVTAMALLAGLTACTGETAQERAAGADDTLSQTGSYYTRGEGNSLEIEGTPTSDMLTAPAVIGPVRLSLSQLMSGAHSENEADRAAHKTLLADLVTAMQTDMKRLGVSDTDDLQELGALVVSQVGGGTGVGEGPDPDEVQTHVDAVERLIALYVAKARSAGVVVDTAKPR